MIFGIGTDIVSVPRIAQSLARFGQRFAMRILAEAEFAEFLECGQRAAFLAKRFAAKEAAAKAFGLGFRDGLALHHISVSHNHHGRPHLVFHERAAELIRELGIGDAHLSLSDERDNAIAFVVFEKA